MTQVDMDMGFNWVICGIDSKPCKINIVKDEANHMIFS
jgi:hypothetical protein